MGIAGRERTHSFCGSPAYLAPEMVTKKGFGKAGDIY
jgi:serine/threonine protein kinase